MRLFHRVRRGISYLHPRLEQGRRGFERDQMHGANFQKSLSRSERELGQKSLNERCGTGGSHASSALVAVTEALGAEGVAWPSTRSL